MKNIILVNLLIFASTVLTAQVDSVFFKDGKFAYGNIDEAAAGRIKILVDGSTQTYQLKNVDRIFVAPNNKRHQKIIDAFLPYTNSPNKINYPETKYERLDLPYVDKKVTYTGVINVDSVSASDLYARAKTWFINTYKSANAVLQLDDKDSGRLIGKGNFVVYLKQTFASTLKTRIQHTISVYVKDNKFKYEITDLRIQYYAGYEEDTEIESWKNPWKQNHKQFILDIDKDIKSTIQSLESAMKNKNKTTSDW